MGVSPGRLRSAYVCAEKILCDLSQGIGEK
jgi:hypothetical protein